MQTAATAATAVTVAAHLPAYTGPLGRFLQKQAEVKAAREASAQQEAVLRAMRSNIMEMMIEPLFNAAECLRANDSVYQTTCIAKLQTWFRNVYRVYKERETALYMAFEDGTYTHLPVAA